MTRLFHDKHFHGPGDHAHGHVHSHDPAGLTKRAAIASVATALFLLALKAFAAWQTGSVAMLGSLADTGLDLIASLVLLYGVRVAAMPADHDHRFGHGKAEALAALFQVALIAVAAIVIGARAFRRLGSDAATTHADFGIGVSLVAIAATLGLLFYQRAVIRRTNSIAIKADHVHYQTDVLLNLSVIAALGLERFLGVTGADPAFGVAIAAWLLWGAWTASSRAVDQLMDKEWPEAKRARFLEAAARQPALKGLHDLRTRTSGSADFVQFHVWVDPRLTVAAAHDMMDDAELALQREFPGTEFLIHLDPEGHTDREGMLSQEYTERRVC
ncbi:MAG: Ferrous-iron efflux pump FieF [uncultured Sphingomonadaceae bacterium]|uniref:Ferrous-iron efflux pump FieF n=1 Tax=uncultured Sphingomonadaceae bacterium TaxID=169976 RepID=A0A6J4U032_9SPHN|nr:MAG: Ferrous-iron efflux pump FieF [uncultured Sphingomonadaceae bacterium]